MKRRPPLNEVHQNISFDAVATDTPKTVKPVTEKPYKKNSLIEIPIDKIVLDKNIRDTYADDSLEQLGDSIVENGQIQPVIVALTDKGYKVKVGHRRVKACMLRDIPFVKCIVEDNFEDEKQRIIIQAIENEQRLNLSSREREAYIAQLLDLGMSQVEIAKALHKTKGWVSEAITAFNFVNDNQEIFEDLVEEPSTRDAWIASKLPKDQLKSAVQEAKNQGGTKEAFKKEISKRYNQNSADRKKHDVQTFLLSNSVRIDFENKEVSVETVKSFDKELDEVILEGIKRYYKKQGYNLLSN
ncbi:MAG: ParB/RepB/Spo0J family partition protein [Treponema sp.]|nr:ParB/RepB/Spo0J family partition protein [Treponema sp.]